MFCSFFKCNNFFPTNISSKSNKTNAYSCNVQISTVAKSFCTWLLPPWCRISHASGLLQHEATLHLRLWILLVDQTVLLWRLPVHTGGESPGLWALDREQLLLPHRQLLPRNLQRLPQHCRILCPWQLLPAPVSHLILSAFLHRRSLTVIPGKAVVGKPLLRKKNKVKV